MASHKTTIDQHRGEHEATGLPIYQLHEVTTEFGDYSQERWVDLSADDREYWLDVLADIHAARVELEGLDDDTRRLAKDLLSAEDCDDPGQVASLIRRSIAEARWG